MQNWKTDFQKMWKIGKAIFQSLEIGKLEAVQMDPMGV